MKKFHMVIIACASMIFALSASAAPQVWCKFVANETAHHPDGTSNPWSEDMGFGYFIVDFSGSGGNYGIIFVNMTIDGPENAAQVNVGTAPSTGGFENFPSESLFNGVIDFTQPVDKTFAVSGNPLVNKNQYTETYLQSLRLVCTTQNPYGN